MFETEYNLFNYIEFVRSLSYGSTLGRNFVLIPFEIAYIKYNIITTQHDIVLDHIIRVSEYWTTGVNRLKRKQKNDGIMFIELENGDGCTASVESEGGVCD